MDLCSVKQEKKSKKYPGTGELFLSKGKRYMVGQNAPPAVLLRLIVAG